MKIPSLLNANIEECEKESIRRNLIADNIRRGKMLAIAIIGLELIIIIIDTYASIIKVDDRFRFNEYLIMYSIMILLNILFIVFIKKYENFNSVSIDQLKKIEIGIVAYITLIMSWGSIISLMDQEIYGQIIVFMVNMITCSIIYVLDNRKILVPYLSSFLIIFIGLPFFQSSEDILIGHYVNLCAFVFISWLASRFIYLNYCSDFKSKFLLENSKILLEKEIEENQAINIKLAIANLQLKEAALIDDLLGIPNRRSFRNYIDNVFEKYVKEDSVLSVLMIDIDFFKQFNDNYGHEEGDRALIAVASQINSMVKSPMEFVARWGGEEFIYVLFNTTEEDTSKLAETIIQKIHELKIIHEFSKNNNFISVSIGTCTIKLTGIEDVSRGIVLADKALYLAKNSGRNCAKNIEH